MIEIYLKDDNMHIFVMINALICINNYVITCINNMLSMVHLRFNSHDLIIMIRTLAFHQSRLSKIKRSIRQLRPNLL